MSTLDIQQERQMFEMWFLSTGKQKFFLAVQIDGTRYVDNLTELAWQSWLAAKQHTTQQSGWISVADRLPENPSQEVNILLKTGEVRIALFEQWIPMGQTKPVHYFTGDIYHIDGCEYQCTTFDDVTHWQPLPNPPMEVET